MLAASQAFLTQLNYSKILLMSGLAIFMGLGFAGFLLPKIVRLGMRMQLRVTPGTMSRKMFEVVPFPLDYRLFVLNVTNKDEVMAGGKPKLQEIGPYYFEEYKDKYDIVDNKAEDTMEYEYRNTYYYKPELSGPGLTGNEIVTVAHPLILAMVLSLNVDRPELLGFAKTAIEGILHDPEDIFFTGRLWDLLYDGIYLDCSSDIFEVTAVCSEFDSGDYGEIRRVNETTFNFSLFGNTNGSSIGRFTSLRGKKNIRDLGSVLRYNGESEMDAWYEDECNEIHGTDGTIFPPFHEKEEGFKIFVPQMCKTLHAEYQHPSKYAGIKTNRFTVDFDVNRFGPANCFCRDHEVCPPAGMLDLFPCIGTPIAISKPHFYQVDPAVLEKVEGLSPNADKHEFFFDVYQYAGAPVSAMGRGQINFEIVPVEEIPFMKDLQSMYLPMMWFEDGVNLEKKYTNMLKYQLILVLKIRILLMFGLTLAGVIGIIIGGIACYMQSGTDNQSVRSKSIKSNISADKPKVQSIEIIST